MTRNKPLVFGLMVTLVLCQIPVFAAEVQGRICGRMYQSDMKTPLGKGELRIVNVQTGAVQASPIKKNGCYCTDKSSVGNYSVSYFDGTAEYMLPEKMTIHSKTTTAACFAPAQNNTLTPVADCNVCKDFPLLGWVIIGAGGAAAGTAVIIGTGEEEIASPSQQ